MQTMILETLADAGLSRVRATNYSTNGYPTKIPTTTSPAGTTGVIPMGEGGAISPSNLLLVPYGAGSSTNTFGMKVLGWNVTQLNAGTPLWIPVELWTLACTLGTATGIANADLDTTALFTTTITSTGGPTFITSGAAPISLDWLEISPGSNSIGMACCRSFGFAYLEVIFTTGGSATSANALFRKF